MFVAQTEKTESLDAKGMFMTNPRADVHDGKARERRSTIEESPVSAEISFKASIPRQIQLLAHREALNIVRDYPALGGRFGVTILLNLLFGLIFLGAGNRDDSDYSNFSSHFGALTMVSIASLFGTAQPVMLGFPFERPMFMREYSTGSYTALAYFISKAVAELPLAFIQIVVQYIIVYFMCGFKGNWILMVLSAWGIGLSASSSAVILGCAVADAKQVTELAPLVFVPQLLFAGFFIRTSQIPVFIRWAQWLCGLKYGMNLLVLTEFNPANPSCQGGAAANCASIISSNDIVSSQWWVYMLLLIVIFTGFRTIGCIVLVQRAKRFY